MEAADLVENIPVNDPTLAAGDVVVTEAAPAVAGIVFTKIPRWQLVEHRRRRRHQPRRRARL